MGQTYASLGFFFFKQNEVMQICNRRDATLICAYAMVEEIENSTRPFVINSGVSQKSSDTM
jgi:hypothetical protein